MKLYSTNNKANIVSFKKALLEGLAEDGGLYMPQEIGRMPKEFLAKLAGGPAQRSDDGYGNVRGNDANGHSKNSVEIFREIAFEVAQVLLKDDIDSESLKKIIWDAFDFDAPLKTINKNVHALELFHGPTLAFKDFGARFLSRLMSYFLKEEKAHNADVQNSSGTHKITVLVATSGDTGSAVANGFFKVPGIDVVLLYPSGKVSKIQEQQLTTMGKNITALEIEGVFDDCQKLVKQAFVDKELMQNFILTSANSINIGRLLGQIFYYFYAYYQLGDKTRPAVISVPSGNFGNLTAGLIAKKMGLPVHQFIAATNANNVFEEYMQTSKFTPRNSVETMSNAMDVGNPSNFARIMELYENSHQKLSQDVWSKSFSDTSTAAAIKEIYNQYNYLMDPHSAVAYLGLFEYQKQNPSTNGIFLVTAHPAKFADKVEPIINKKIQTPDRLAKCLQKEKHSTKLPSDFNTFKDFLLNMKQSKQTKR